MKCPACGAEVGDDDYICPNCDEVLKDDFMLAGEDDAPGGNTRRKVRDSGSDYAELKETLSSLKERFLAMDFNSKIGAVLSLLVVLGSLMAWIKKGSFTYVAGTELGGWLTALGGVTTFVLLFIGGNYMNAAALAGILTGLACIAGPLAALAGDGGPESGLFITLAAGTGLGVIGVQHMLHRFRKPKSR